MTLNTMLYDHIHKDMEIMSVNVFRESCNDICAANDNNPLKEQVEPEPTPIPTPDEVQNPCYIRWQI